ncbi:YidC/Oxa1 family membrane protein insertase [Nocardia transvalensis]|uniref:Membrane protein insertase YidC n=1 Tax=Nocardia transvalensis TaxID=37333 RepID=A0A7W9PFB2_9NOCA|nr:membrane protein insertase YidC [Nocardia transvalensis]MBB5915020.1 YidC/Oxa1 family membrane protein insertase [Nocardia transvalensis]
MLDFVYYPVSGVLWLWHTGFAAVLGAGGSLAWVAAIVLLVVTVRALLVRPFLAQVKFSRTMAILQPEVRKLQAKYADDREKLVAETRRLQEQHNFSLLRGCLPMAGQLLLFLGLYHVLRSFDRTGPVSHVPLVGNSTSMTAAENASTANYLFSPDQVQSFLNAKLLDAPLSATLATSGGSMTAVLTVVIPLVLIAGLATHFTARSAITRQLETTPQTRMINWLSLWIFPLGAAVAGVLMPVGILVYFATSNTWTFVQQHLVHKRLGPMPVPGQPDAQDSAKSTPE